jgi:hypothetical protein
MHEELELKKVLADSTPEPRKGGKHNKLPRRVRPAQKPKAEDAEKVVRDLKEEAERYRQLADQEKKRWLEFSIQNDANRFASHIANFLESHKVPPATGYLAASQVAMSALILIKPAANEDEKVMEEYIRQDMARLVSHLNTYLAME